MIARNAVSRRLDRLTEPMPTSTAGVPPTRSSVQNA